MRVVFPAPFSPSRAWTSPARTSKLTRSLARTPGKVLVMSRMRTSGGCSARAGRCSRDPTMVLEYKVGGPPWSSCLTGRTPDGV